VAKLSTLICPTEGGRYKVGPRTHKCSLVDRRVRPQHLRFYCGRATIRWKPGEKNVDYNASEMRAPRLLLYDDLG